MAQEPNYTFNGNRVYRSVDAVCNRLRLKPSRLLPRFPPPPGIYQKGTKYSRRSDAGETVYMEFIDGYQFLQHVLAPVPVLGWIAGQLFEVRCGVYDWIDPASWHRVKPGERPFMNLVIGDPPGQT